MLSELSMERSPEVSLDAVQVITKFFVSHDGKNANMTAQLQQENDYHGDMVILGPDALGPGKVFLEGIPGVASQKPAQPIT